MGCSFISTLLTMGSVAYYILLERKLLGMMQLRKGPNKSGLVGLVLPLADALKGLTKELLVPSSVSGGLFLVGPLVLFTISYYVWTLAPNGFAFFFYTYSALYFICAVGVNVFGVMWCGWSSGCSYGLLGGMRAGAQAVSYEIVYTSALSCPMLCVGSAELYDLRFNSLMLILVMLELGLVWAVASLAELNRTPFDFVEGESELVSGYMVEYGGVGFILIILAEYGSIVFCSCMTACLFFGGLGYGHVPELAFVMLIAVFSAVIVLIRGSFPRYRYDKLMSFCWEVLLPMVSGLILLYLSLAAYSLYFI